MIEDQEQPRSPGWGFSPETRQPELFKAWKLFIKTGQILKNVVPPYIADSWIRSRKYGIDPLKISPQAYLTADMHRKRIDKNKRLIKLASPIMENLFESFGKSQYVVALYDSDGYHLIRLTHPEVLRYREKIGIKLGLRFHEKTVGTCGPSLAKRLKRPVCVAGCENYLYLLHPLSGVYAPIFHPESKKLVGIMAVGGANFIKYPHAESIVVAASSAIENLLKLDHAKEEIWVYSKSLQLTIDSLNDGIIVVDRQGNIYEMNMTARKLLGLDQTNSRNVPISRLSGCKSLVKHVLSVLQSPDRSIDRIEECIIGNQTFLIEMKVARNQRNQIRGILVQLKNIRDLSLSARSMTEYQPRYSLENIIGSSKAIGEVKQMIRDVAITDGPVIIEGESGTGKEIVAQAIHNASRRKLQPFIAVNCAAVPLELIESIIFGHKKGAFTGATSTQVGKFELAEGGTLFLDEIADMPKPMQAKMLRAIEERKIERIGGIKPIDIDVRILAATNKKLLEQVQKNNFRQDLFFRLNVFRITIPPLRKRKEDIPDLIYHIINEFSPILKKRIRKVSKSYIDTLVRQPLIGNVRELRNAIQNSMTRLKGYTLTASSLKGFFPKEPTIGEDFSKTVAGDKQLADVKKELIVNSLKLNKGNKTKAAKALGISRATFYRWLELYHLDTTSEVGIPISDK